MKTNPGQACLCQDESIFRMIRSGSLIAWKPPPTPGAVLLPLPRNWPAIWLVPLPEVSSDLPQTRNRRSWGPGQHPGVWKIAGIPGRVFALALAGYPGQREGRVLVEGPGPFVGPGLFPVVPEDQSPVLLQREKARPWWTGHYNGHTHGHLYDHYNG